MPKLTDYQRQHIILLVGENPLPNYVAAKLLLSPGGTAHLLCSKATQLIADRLGEMLKLEPEKFKYHRIQLLDEESDGFKIYNKITDHLDHNIPDGESVGLNYTGGTKVMAIHAYQALKDHRKNCVFSYLNPRALELCIEEQVNQLTRPISVSTEFKPSLEKILELHNLKLLGSGSSNEQLIEIASDFAEYVSELQLGKSEKFKAKNVWDDWHISRGEDRENIIATSGVSPEYFKEWQEGYWLEYYTFSQINQIAKQFSLHDIFMSIRVQDPRKREREKKKERFEFDIVFLHGYQLFGISCATSQDRGKCKLKLIEADLRAKQLGGSEARVALVCCYKSAEELKEEVRLMGVDPKVEVFDRTELDPDTLSENLTAWIKKNIED